ncbi:MAG: hypothetical protein LBE12_09980 [Planctomycetaceae bacterium]|jgi:hypothetical protein|nr:hypothetical protein [Planctomycetaceae bacterium]
MISAKLQPKINKIQDLRRRGYWKKAYKEALFLSRLHNEPELQELLASSLWEWIKEQFNRNQREEAKTNIKELLRLIKNPNIKNSEIQKEFPAIFRVLGLNALLPEHLRQDMNSPEIQIELVDRFLVYGENSDDLLPDLRDQAILIKKAFEKVEAKLDNEALELLHPISFHSPLSEWRLFIRGLISYYNKNDEKANESWKRLSDSRPPYQIVSRLRKFFTDDPNASSSNFVSRFFDLFRAKTDSVQTEKIEFFNHLRQLDNYIRQKKYKELIGHFQVSRSFLQKTDPLLFDRVFRTVHFTLVDEAKPEIVRQFAERNLPLPFDPRGNRTLGLLSLNFGSSTSMREKGGHIPRWLRDPLYYFELFAEHDIDQIKSFTPNMKARAKAVIYSFLGNLIMQSLYNNDFDSYHNEDEIQGQEKISKYFDKAIAYDPTYLITYSRLQEFYCITIPEHENNQHHPKIAEVYRKLIEHVPNNIEALKYLFQYYIAEENYADALHYLERIQTLEPLSREPIFLKRKLQYVRLKELLQLNQEHSEIEQLFKEIEETNLNTIEYNYDLVPLALRYIYETISNHPSEAENVFTLAEKVGLEKRLPLILTIFLEVENFPKFPVQVLQSFQDEWNSAITGRCNGNLAGALGNIAYTIMVEKKTFTNSKQILLQIFDFINRSAQVKWKTEKDIYGACKVLWYLAVKLRKHDYDAMYKKLVQKGLSQFPLSPYFLFFDAEIFFLESRYYQMSCRDSTIKKYQSFIEQCGHFRNDPVLEFYLNEAKLRFDDIDYLLSYGYDRFDNKNYEFFDDEDDDDDDDGDDYYKFDNEEEKLFSSRFNSSRNIIDIPPDLKESIAKGVLPPELKQDLINSLPEELGELRVLMFDTFLECLAQGIPMDQVDKYLMKKADSLPPLERMRFISAIVQISSLQQNEKNNNDDDDDDDNYLFPTPKHFKKKKKNKR